MNIRLEKEKLSLVVGIGFAAMALFSLISMFLHFSFAALLFFLGAALMTAGMFVPNMKLLTVIGFGISALGAFVQILGTMILEFGFRYFNAFFLLYPVLGCLLMIACFVVLLVGSIKTKLAKWLGLGAAAGAMAVVMILVGAAMQWGAVRRIGISYLEFLKWLIAIPSFAAFAVLMDQAEPVISKRTAPVRTEYYAPNPYAQPANNYTAPNYLPPVQPENNYQGDPAGVSQPSHRRRSGQYNAPAQPMEYPHTEAPAMSMHERIEQLQQLKVKVDSGAISEEEFMAAKQQILHS